jgi:1-acyl-sn-glycerol-3-phosphate acyltransferase
MSHNVDIVTKSAKTDQYIEHTARVVLTLTQTLSSELQRGQHTKELSLDTLLERELGFDSLAMGEMMLRAEHQFQVSLPQQLLAKIETPRDLLREIMLAHPAGTKPQVTSEIKALHLGDVEPTPDHVKTLPAVLDWHVQAHPDRPHILLHEDDQQITEISYGDLQRGAQEVAAGLLAHDIEAGQTVAIMLPTCRDYFDCFCGILIAGCVPVPIYPPARPSQLEDHLRRHAGILNNAQSRLLLTVPEAKAVAQLLKAQAPNLKGVLTVDEIRHAGQALTETTAAAISAPSVTERDTAFLQYTSGSTGSPKGVILSHANLLANIRAIGQAIQLDATDVVVSWLPLYHDMGLIASWLSCLYFAVPFVVMSPLLFLSRPQRWLWAIHLHRGTLSAAPNFAYELCLRQIKDKDLEGLDLSSWRCAFNGAEPVSPTTLVRFTERFRPYGFRPETMAPVYGLAESSVGLAIPPMGRPPLIDHIAREPLMRDGLAQPVGLVDARRDQLPGGPLPENKADSLEFVSVGHPLPGHQIRIVDDSRRELPERQEGHLEFQGPSATSGYFRNAEASKKLFHGQWLDSGDRAYQAGGDIFITGRNKDIIIRAGRNLHPHQLEEMISGITGVRKGCVAVFASKDARLGTEQLVVLAETREQDAKVRAQLQQEIVNLCMDLMGSPPNDVVLAPPHTVPKTSSGKIRRAASCELYEQGTIGQAQRVVWVQLLRVVLAGVKPELRRGRQHLTELSYSGYCWLLLGLTVPVAWLLIALTPPFRWASNWPWALAQRAGKLLLKLSATTVQVTGLEHLPQQGNCVLVANHCSYLDGLVLLVSLPWHYSFVAKLELTSNFFARIFLSRLHTQFVERYDLQKGVADARNLAKSASAGQSLLFFPEGTFHRMPGLHSFHMGAFVAAVDAGAPVVPISLRGTRSKLRDKSWFVRRGGVSIICGAPIQPSGSDWAAAIQLRNDARLAILRQCGEPDLAHDDILYCAKRCTL